MNLTTYLRRPNARIVLLAEIDYEGSSPLYLADRAYITEPGDTPANTMFAPAIAPDSLPRLSQKLQNVMGGAVVGSWGDLNLVSHRARQGGADVDLSTYALEGLSIRLKITAPRASVAYSEAITIFDGRIGDVKGRTDGSITLELEDKQSALDEIIIPTERYDSSTEAAGFPSSNENKIKPMLIGWCRNVAPVLIDADTWTYQVDAYAPAGAVEITWVTDNGISIGYTDNGDGTFSLGNPPSGRITCDANYNIDWVGTNYFTWESSILAIADHLISNYTDLGSTVDGFEEYWTGQITRQGVYLDRQVTVGGLLSEMARGMFCAAGFDGNTYRIDALDTPPSGGPIFAKKDRLGEVEWWRIRHRYNRIPVLRWRNWTKMETLASSITDPSSGSYDPSLAEFLRSDGYEGYGEDTTDIAANGTLEAPRFDSFYLTYSSAFEDSVADRALSFFGEERHGVKFTVPMSRWDWSLHIGSGFELADTPVDGDYILTAIRFRNSSGVPSVEVEGMG